MMYNYRSIYPRMIRMLHYCDYNNVCKIIKEKSPDTMIIDVRGPDEVRKSGSIPTSHNIPLTELATALTISPSEFQEKFGFNKPTTSQTLVFSCHLGMRAKTATQLATSMGYKAVCYEGSFQDWSSKHNK